MQIEQETPLGFAQQECWRQKPLWSHTQWIRWHARQTESYNLAGCKGTSPIDYVDAKSRIKGKPGSNLAGCKGTTPFDYVDAKSRIKRRPGSSGLAQQIWGHLQVSTRKAELILAQFYIDHSAIFERRWIYPCRIGVTNDVEHHVSRCPDRRTSRCAELGLGDFSWTINDLCKWDLLCAYTSRTAWSRLTKRIPGSGSKFRRLVCWIAHTLLYVQFSILTSIAADRFATV